MSKVLEHFGLGDAFVKWVKLLFSSPQAAVQSNEITFHLFTLERGTRQGSPLSPHLFELIIEPLAKAIRAHQVSAVSNVENVISLYADDVLLFLDYSVKSIPNAVDTINKFTYTYYIFYQIEYEQIISFTTKWHMI